MSCLAINSDALEVFLSSNKTNLRVSVIKTTKKDCELNTPKDYLVLQHYERCCNFDKLSYVEVGVSCLYSSNIRGI